MLISIITINYNNLPGLKKTMKSVLDQSYSSIEYLVIDGASSDGSKEFIEQHNNNLVFWVSEPDNGLYHAMNKGIDKANGDYLLFLNSGDWLVNSSVIKDFVSLNPKEDIVYGDPLVMENGKWQRKPMPKVMNTSIALTHTISHQSQFYRSNIFNDNTRYSEKYKVISDWIFTTNAIAFKKCSSRHIDLEVCYFDEPGISGDFEVRHKERIRYLNENLNSISLEILKDYSKLQSRLKTLNNSRLIRLSLWILDKKSRILNYFKNT